MKKILALILVLTMMLCALVSCKDNASNNDDEEDIKKKTYKVDDEKENKEKNDGEDKENNEKTESKTKKNTDPILNHLLTNPEYKELIQRAVNDYEFSKTANFDPHPYAYLTKKGYDVEAIKSGTMECVTMAYILEEKPNSLFLLTKVLNKSTNVADHIQLEFNLSEQQMELYKEITSRPYVEAAFINDALSTFKNPVKETLLKMSVTDSKGIDASLEHYSKYLKSVSTITFVLDANEETQTFDCVILPKFKNAAKKSEKSSSIGFATFDSVEPIMRQNNYCTLPAAFNRMMEIEGKAVPAIIYNIQDLNWTYCTLDFEKDYGNK